MSGGRFGLNVVINSETILSYRVLIKTCVSFRMKGITADKDTFGHTKKLFDVLNIRSKIWQR